MAPSGSNLPKLLAADMVEVNLWRSRPPTRSQPVLMEKPGLISIKTTLRSLWTFRSWTSSVSGQQTLRIQSCQAPGSSGCGEQDQDCILHQLQNLLLLIIDHGLCCIAIYFHWPVWKCHWWLRTSPNHGRLHDHCYSCPTFWRNCLEKLFEMCKALIFVLDMTKVQIGNKVICGGFKLNAEGYSLDQSLHNKIKPDWTLIVQGSCLSANNVHW